LWTIGVAFGVAELKQAVFGEDGSVGVGGGGVDAEERRIETVDANGVRIEVSLEGLPGSGVGKGTEEIGEAVVVEVKGTDRLAEARLKGEAVLLGPGLEFVEAMITLGKQEAKPNGENLTGGQLAPPEVVSGIVSVEELSQT
jgi:hypothetical protein